MYINMYIYIYLFENVYVYVDEYMYIYIYIYRLVDVGCLKPCRFDLKISSSHLQGVVHGAGALPFVAQLPSGGLGIKSQQLLFVVQQMPNW